MTTPSEETRKAKEVVRQEQFWFTATTLGFTGFVGALLTAPSLRDLIVSLALIWLLGFFTVYLIVGRHKAYCALNGLALPGWGRAFVHALRDVSGALYCSTVVLFAAVGFTLILLMRHSAPATVSRALTSPPPPAQPASLPLSTPAAIPRPLTNPINAQPTNKP